MKVYSESERQDISDQLDKILRSQDFKRSVRLTQFLKYIVQKTLDGDGDKLKGYTIGIEVFGKPQDFNPDTDASVRVEATRLRKALALYYSHEGQEDSLSIQIPKGSYKPLFLFNPVSILSADAVQTAGVDLSPPVIHSSKQEHRRGVRVGLFAGFVIAVLVVLLGFLYGTKSVLSAADVTPVIALAPVHVLGADTGAAAQEFPLRLLNNLKRFSGITVFDGAGWVNEEDTQAARFEAMKKTGANYILEAEIQGFPDRLNVNARLLDLKKTTYVWSIDQNYSPQIIMQPDQIDEVTGMIASQLASPYGVIYNLEQERLNALKGPAAETYRCVMDYYAYCNNKTVQGHAQVRQCLESAVKREPKNPELWAYLSWIYGNEVRSNHNLIGDEAGARKRMNDAALRALQTDPSNARAHQYAAIALLFNGDEKQARRHKIMSVELNPYDSEILADAAWFFGQVGEWEKSRTYAEKSIEINPGHARWYYGILFAYYYQAGNYDQSLAYALKYAPTDDIFSDVAIAASYAGLNRMTEARKMAEKIEKKYPNLIKQPFETLSKLGFTKKDTEKLILGVEAAGVPISYNQTP